MRRRLAAVLLCLCMMLTLLPTPAYAAVRELVGNSAEENQALLEELETLTGQDGEAVLELRLSSSTGRSTPWRRSRPC